MWPLSVFRGPPSLELISLLSMCTIVPRSVIVAIIGIRISRCSAGLHRHGGGGKRQPRSRVPGPAGAESRHNNNNDNNNDNKLITIIITMIITIVIMIIQIILVQYKYS